MKTVTLKAITATALLVTLAGCTASGSGASRTSESSGPTAEPSVILHVPETAAAGGIAELVIDSAGHDGETVQLYAFTTPYDQVADCSDTTVKPLPVNLAGGPQKVSTNVAAEGDMWFVLTGDGIGTDCGLKGSRLRVLQTFAPVIQVCDGGVSCPDISEAPVRAAGQPFTYRVSAKSEKEPPAIAKVSVAWVGPFANVPEAQSTPCKKTPVAFTDEGTMVWKDGWAGPSWNQSIKSPGVYRLMLTIGETAYTAPYETSCESAPLVTVR